MNKKYDCSKVKTEVDVFKIKLNKFLERYDNFMQNRYKMGGGELLLEYRNLTIHAHRLYNLLPKLDQTKDASIIKEYTILYNRIKEMKIF